MNIVITNSSKLPIYEQIVVGIKEEIINGNLESKELLPSIRSLAKDLNISVITTKRAYEELERQGFIEIVPGKGTFVSFFNKELIYEEKLKEIESKLQEVIAISQVINLEKADVLDILDTLYE